MSLYKGYAQQRGFDPVKVPMNESEKIRKQGLRALSQMNETYEFERRQAQQFADVFNSNFKLEQKLFDQQGQDARSYGEIVHKAKLQNLQVSIDDAKRKSARGNQTLNNLKAIANFAQTAGDAYMKVEGQRRKNIDTMVSGLITNYGLPFKDLQILKNGTNASIDGERTLSGVLKDLEARGVPHDVIAQLSKGGSYLSFALGKQQAMIRARGYQAYLAQVANEDVEVAGATHSLMSALREPKILQVVLDKHRSNYLRNKDGDPYFSDKVLTASGANATLRQVDANWHQRSTQQAAQSFKKDENQKLGVLLNDFTGNAGDDTQKIVGLPGVFKLIEVRAGPKPGPNASKEERRAYKRKRRAAVQEITSAIKPAVANGTLPYAQISGVDDFYVGPGTGIEIDGLTGGKKQLASKIFPELVKEIRNAHKAAETLENTKLDATRSLGYIDGKKFARDIEKYIQSGERNANVIRSLTSRGMEMAAGDPNHPAVAAVQRLQRNHSFHRNQENDAAGLKYLRERAEDGYLPSVEEIEGFNLSPNAHAEALKIREQILPLMPTAGKTGTAEQIKEAVDGAIQGIVQKKQKDALSSTWGNQQRFATAQMNRWYMSYLQSPGKTGDHQGAFDYALGQLQAIATIDSKHPDWKTTTVSGVKEFSRAVVGKQDAIVIGRGQIQKELNADPGLIFKKEYFDKTALLSFSSKVNRGRSPNLLNRATLIESLTEGRILGVDAIQAQLQMYRNKEIAETGSSDIQLLPDNYIKEQREYQHWIGPNGCHLADSYNLVDINKACMSQKEDGTNGNPAYISQVVAKKAELEARVQDYVVKNPQAPPIDSSTSFEYFMLDRLTNFLDHGMKDFTYKDFLRGTSIWRDPIFMKESTVYQLWSSGFYNTEAVQ